MSVPTPMSSSDRLSRPSVRPTKARSGARILVDQLRVQGVRRVFGVPGESYLAVLDALADHADIPYTICRHEGGAAHMAEAWGKLGNGPGICFVTRGPGATHAAIGVHTAQQDSTPMLLFIGQVGTDFLGREAFQEVDYGQFFGGMAKRVVQLDRPDRIPELLSQAFHLATSGRPGPVVVVMPEDVLTMEAVVADAPPHRPVYPAAAPAQMQQMHELLAQAQRPLLLVGGSRWSSEARDAVRDYARLHNIPVACAWRFQDSFDNTDPNYCGEVGIGINPALAQRVREADVIVAAGIRLGEMTTSGYALLDVPAPQQHLVHIYPDPNEFGRVYVPELAICSAGVEWALALSTLPGSPHPAWSDRATWLTAARADYAAWRQPPAQPGALDYPAIVLELDRMLPHDAILTNGAGNFATPVHRLYRHRQHRTQLAPSSGAMGYALPAAIAARLAYPDRVVIAFTGDGDFQMTVQELATARQAGAAVTVILVDNGMYGTIRMHQERHFPGRVSGTSLLNPDFAALAGACDCHGETVSETAGFAPAFERAMSANAAGRPAVLVLRIDPEALTVNQTLSQIRDRVPTR